MDIGHGVQSQGALPRQKPGRKTKVDDSKERRIPIACQPCRQRRSRCDGGRPCSVCQQTKSQCVYQHSDRRVWISQANYLRLLEERDELKRRNDILTEQLRSEGGRVGPSESATTSGSEIGSLSLDSPQVEGDDKDEELVAAAGRLLTDDRGVARYMGDISGAAFYSAIMDVLPLVLPQHAKIKGPHTSSSYHTWDSRPLPVSTANPFVLPPLNIARELVSIFFQHCSDLFHFLSPDSFNNDMDMLYANGGAFHPTAQHEVLTLGQFYLVLALGSLHAISPLDGAAITANELGGVSTATDPPFPGMEHFARSTVFLPGFSEHSSLNAVKLLSLTAYYLFSVSHRDASYIYIGAAMRASVALGLHRMASVQGLDHVQCVFWTVYILDRLISSVLGRPVQLMDDEISTPRPGIPPLQLRAMGLGMHVRILSLAGLITRELFVPSPKDRTRHLFSLSAALRLSARAADLSKEIQQTKYSFTNPRSEILLKLGINQVINMVCRHSLLHALRMKSKGNASALEWLTGSPTTPGRDLESTLALLCKEAITAAIDTAHLLHWMYMTNMTLPWCFFDNHCAYNAGVVLIISKLVDLSPSPSVDTEIGYIYEVLTLLSSKGNESAMSCKAIMETLSQATAQMHTPVLVEMGPNGPQTLPVQPHPPKAHQLPGRSPQYVPLPGRSPQGQGPPVQITGHHSPGNVPVSPSKYAPQHMPPHPLPPHMAQQSMPPQVYVPQTMPQQAVPLQAQGVAPVPMPGNPQWDELLLSLGMTM